MQSSRRLRTAAIVFAIALLGRSNAEGQTQRDPKPSLKETGGAGGCCGTLSTVAARFDSNSVVKPRLSLAELGELKLPDVKFTSVEHHQDSAQPVGREERTFAGVAGSGAITAPHVRVTGIIGGTIHFELLLPDEWNSRFVMGGGGGFVGRVINWARFTVNHGFVTVGTDTGHQSASVMSGDWALNNLEAQLNFGYLAVHRTAEVAKAITREYYGAGPEYSYYVGCSRGGGQGLMEAQRYPEDFDGIVSAAPALNWPGFTAAALYSSQRLYPDPQNTSTPVLSRENLNQLHTEVLRQCDGRDGLEDGLIDDPAACQLDLSRLTQFTEAQKEAIRAIYEGPKNERGRIFPGIPLGAEGAPDGWFYWITGPVPPSLMENLKYPSVGFAMGTEFYRNFILSDPDWNYLDYDFSTWERDTQLHVTFLNATNPDLSRFQERGGKLILWHGWGDSILTAYATIDYYKELEKEDPNARSYARLYLLPGVMHCLGGPGPDSVDWLSAIVDWVERDKAPERLIATKHDGEGKPVMTRPLHPYPQRAVYQGIGSPKEAQNFILK
jgi:hypothetical protein